MADSQKGSAYGAPASDTDFRKTYDLDEYAARAKDREDKEKEERKARYEAKLAGKKYYKPLTGEETLTSARREVLNFASRVGQTSIVPADGRAGFPCAACNRTFKDNKQYVEHLNTKQHLMNAGQLAEVQRATVEDVRARIEFYVRKKEELEKDQATSLQERLKVREEEDEKEREEKREKRREEAERKRLKREETEKMKTEYDEDLRIEGEHDEDDMMAAMGITGFGSSRK